MVKVIALILTLGLASPLTSDTKRVYAFGDDEWLRSDECSFKVGLLLNEGVISLDMQCALEADLKRQLRKRGIDLGFVKK